MTRSVRALVQQTETAAGSTALAQPRSRTNEGGRVAGSTRRRVTVVLGCVLVIVLLAGSNVLGQRTSVLIDDVAQLAGGITATIVCWRTASRRTGTERQWRVLMAAGMACWSAGMAVWAFYRSVLGMPLPTASVADVGFFLFPILAVPALLAFVGPSPWRAASSARHVWVMSLLDGAVVVGSLFVLSWATVLGAVVHSSESESIEFLVAIMYPITDLVLVAMIVLLAVIPRIAARYRTQLTLLGAGILMMAISDSIYAYLVATGADFMPVLTDGGFIAGTALIALAAAAPRTVDDNPAPRDSSTHGSSLYGSQPTESDCTEAVTGARTQLLLPYALMGAIGIVLAILRVQTGELDSTVVVLGVAVVLLSLVRQVITLVQNDNLLRSLTRAQAELTYRAHHDGLTGLLNRSSFDEHLRAAVHDARAGRGRAVLLLIDLDDFKSVNDRFGHGGGDRLLIELARRLDRCVVDGVVARFGGDEFTALVYADLDAGRATAVRIAETMRTAHEIDGHSVSVGVCVGVVQIGQLDRTPHDTTTVAGSDTADEDELMRLADRAMYEAKREGKAGIYAYDTAGALTAVPSTSDQATLGTRPKMVAGEPDPARLIGPPTRT
ncbi:diguanylate cyclase [Rhodococcus sp. IEGM 1401]|uniref:diguanylate cyclase domain-containing protein n=1 Tax=unclassified Rhodococcus (in: high G+C Gram-positive bacteria) TaxID=192944 RepID=UPI0022B42A83|nr:MULTISPECIES: diguanylate cyclase [unclassified Rhodococcus (in: high G+C Gram-positive bacteria)]MCZ4560390.1 diguanylate cyclase [Rhodococcus sp. IEGM 1401]MDI9920517.1 diguanylate cyclase [Rhodococcus sp. IEGM 1372]MDV8032797.1 diguanylate cyclase [Rhodococcus sp. IEGM 1414]